MKDAAAAASLEASCFARTFSDLLSIPPSLLELLVV